MNYNDFLELDESAQIKIALTSDHASEEQVIQRLTQINEATRRPYADNRNAELIKERAEFINSVEFKPLLFVTQFGFEYVPDLSPAKQGASYARYLNGNYEIILMSSFDSGGKLTVRTTYKAGTPNPEYMHKNIDMPTSPEDIYELIGELKAGINFFPKDRANYEYNYVKQLKRAKK